MKERIYYRYRFVIRVKDEDGVVSDPSIRQIYFMLCGPNLQPYFSSVDTRSRPRSRMGLGHRICMSNLNGLVIFQT
jgi:hypothetical protein